MTISDQQFTEEFDGKEEEVYTENGGSDSESNVSDDSQDDPPFDVLEEAQSKFSNLSVEKKPRVRVAKDMDSSSGVDEDEVEIVAVPELDEKDKQSFEHVEKTIEAGQLEKLKVDQCKVYLRKYGLRLTGSKEILIRRIMEHQEIINGDGVKKYPVSSFVLNCKGDACTGDVVMFEQNVYDMYNLASRSASGPPCGTRMVAGRIVKESYGAAKQQHTFTIEVLWTKGEKPLPPLHPLLIKGQNLYRLKTLRQRWEDEGERQRILMDKHSRGAMARSKRETRIQGKEKRKMLTTGVSKKEEPKNKQPQLNPTKFDFSIDPRKVTIQHPQNQTENINPNQSFKLQHSKPFENYMQPNFPPTLLNAYPKASHLIAYPLTSLNRQPAISATQRQPLTSLNHHPAISATQRQRQPLTSLNHHPAIGATQRQPLTSLNHHPAFVATQRQSLTSLNHHPAFVATQRQPLTSVNHDPAIIARQRQPFTSLNHHPAISATQRQPLQSLNHYPAVRAIQRQPLTGMNYCRSPSPKHRQSMTGMNHFRSPSPNHRQPLTRPGQRQQGHMQQLPCRYYTQGRCSLGDRCKFLHESREESGQWRDERLRHY